MNLLVLLLPNDLVGLFEPSYCDEMVCSCIITGASTCRTIFVHKESLQTKQAALRYTMLTTRAHDL